jgi:hypothetical protein
MAIELAQDNDVPAPATPEGLEIRGRYYTHAQLAAAIQACQNLEDAYQVAALANGGGGNVDWSSVDDARGWAQEAIGREGVLESIRLAQEANDHAPQEAANEPAIAPKATAMQRAAERLSLPVVEFKRPDDTEGGTHD